MARIIFFGNERLATGVTTTAPTLRALVNAGHQVAAIVSHHSQSGSSRSKRELEIADVASDLRIPLFLPDKPADIIDDLIGLQADIGVLAAYGKIVPQRVIDIFRYGIINIHPSALPRHRGPIPLEAVILDGSAVTAVSIMRLVKAMDAGPIYVQQTMPLGGNETKQQLADSALALGAQLTVDSLPKIIAGSLQPVPQNETGATYDQLVTKKDGQLDYRKPAARLAREVRAYSGWPGSYTQIQGKDVTVTAVHVMDGAGEAGDMWIQPKQLGFYTSQDILVIDRLKPAGKNEMDASAFLAGTKVLPT